MTFGECKLKGKVTRFKDFNGYGFATGEDGKNYFIHVSQILTTDFKTLEEGQEIDFKPDRSPKGLIARDVIPIGTPQISNIYTLPDGKSIIKKNPFTPQDPIIDPKKFVGRRDIIVNAVDSLFNGKNVLVDGDRGIGKSSVSLQLLYMSQGEPELLERYDIKLDSEFNNAIGDHRCLPGNELSDIVNGLISSLYSNFGKFFTVTEKSSSFSLNSKLVNFQQQTTSERISPSDLSNLFVASSKEFLKNVAYETQGLTFLIDEIDVLGDKVDLASFLKATTEKFRLDSYFSTNFIVSGVSGTATKLIVQHPSSERLFEHVNIPRMSNDEIRALIDASLAGSNVSITNEAKNRIVRLSNEFPQPAHLLGYHSFRFDTDNNIDITDINKAIRFITSSVRRQHFQSKFDVINPGDQTEIVRCMAAAQYEVVPMLYFRQNLVLGELDIVNALDFLIVKLEIVEKQGRDQYRFRDPLFKVYLRMLFQIDM